MCVELRSGLQRFSLRLADYAKLAQLTVVSAAAAILDQHSVLQDSLLTLTLHPAASVAAARVVLSKAT